MIMYFVPPSGSFSFRLVSGSELGGMDLDWNYINVSETAMLYGYIETSYKNENRRARARVHTCQSLTCCSPFLIQPNMGIACPLRPLLLLLLLILPCGHVSKMYCTDTQVYYGEYCRVVAYFAVVAATALPTCRHAARCLYCAWLGLCV